jgi:hypothetical protein
VAESHITHLYVSANYFLAETYDIRNHHFYNPEKSFKNFYLEILCHNFFGNSVEQSLTHSLLTERVDVKQLKKELLELDEDRELIESKFLSDFSCSRNILFQQYQWFSRNFNLV